MDATHGTTGKRSGLSGIDIVTLLAIGLVIVLVSLPRLRVLAREDNQSDAFEIALTLYRALEAHPQLTSGLAEGGSLDLLVAQSPVLRKHLEDVELLDDGRRLRCHGYLFDVVFAEGAPGTGDPIVRAWPWHFEETGRAVYLVTAAGEVLEYANRDGRFGGEQRAPGAALLAGPPGRDLPPGWRSVKLVERSESGRLAAAL